MSEESNQQTGGTGTDPNANLIAMFAHLSGLVGIVIPFANIIAPLIIWQVKKDDPHVNDQGREAVNFQITVTLAGIASVILMIVGIGFLLLVAVYVGALVFMIIAAIKSNNGEAYRYPVALRLIK